MIEVILYTRSDCHLCELARQYLDELQTSIPHHLKIIDVDTDNKLKSLYGFNVPVVIVGPYRLMAPIEKREIWFGARSGQASLLPPLFERLGYEANKRFNSSFG